MPKKARRSSRFRTRSGQTLLMLTFGLVPMFGMMGLVVDIGYMHFVKTAAQTAAEAAASAAIIEYHATVGGSNYTCGGSTVCATTSTACPSYPIASPSNAVEHGCTYAYQHGFTGTNQSVTYTAGVTGVPPTVSGTGNASYWITFRVSQQVPQMFSAILGNLSGTVTGRSTGAVFGASDCIYALKGTGSGISLSGNPSLTSACGIFVNSSDSTQALAGNGTPTISAPEYDIVGGTSLSLTPAPNTGVSPASDPLSALPVPASAPYHCDHTNYNPSGDVSISPGVYCGGIHVGNQTITMSAGTYILVGGGLSTQSANSHLDGTAGVTIYNTYGLDDTGHNWSFSGISMGGNSTVQMKAPSTGTNAGILFFDDRSATGSDSYDGGSSSYYQGTIYAKGIDITYVGNSNTTAAYTLLVANTITMKGTSSINNDYSSLPNGSPLQQTVLVE